MKFIKTASILASLLLTLTSVNSALAEHGSEHKPAPKKEGTPPNKTPPKKEGTSPAAKSSE